MSDQREPNERSWSDDDLRLLRLIGSTLRRIINDESVDRIITDRRDEIGILVNMVNRSATEFKLNRQRYQQTLGELEQQVTKLQVAQATQERLEDTIAEISTPILNIFEQIALLPLIGHIDTARADQMLSTLLNHVATMQSRVVILDITGVLVLDTRVAHVLIQAAQSCRLLGARVILCGMTPEVAQVVVSLGINLSIFTTQSDLQAALSTALRMINRQIVSI